MYLVIDTETTGLPDWRLPADAEGQPRLASWCFILADAGAINGLTNERLQAEGLAEACEIILKEKLEGAHDAVNDARACLRLLRSICGSPRREEESR